MDLLRPQSNSPHLRTKLHRLGGIVEFTANLVITCALLFAGFVWWHQAHTGTSQVAACGSNLHSAPPPGTPISLPGIDWVRHPSTLVVAISSTCPHCVKESSYYSGLTRSAHRIPIVVVMPQPLETAQTFLDTVKVHPSQTISADLSGIHVETAQTFLDTVKVHPSQTISADLSGIHVSVTPTLMLVSSSGVVQQAWAGELDESQRREVLSFLDHL